MNSNFNYNLTSIEEVQKEDIVITIVSKEEATHGVGRKVQKCTTCQKVHNFYARIEAMTGYAVKGHAVHIGWEDEEGKHNCLLPKDYHASENEYEADEMNTNMDGHDNKTKTRKPHLSIEFELYSRMYGIGREAVRKALGLVKGFPQDRAFTRIYLRLLHVGKKKTGRTNSIELDCTVSAEGHVRFRSLEGLQKFLAGCTIEELNCLRNVRCGAHMHASCDYARRDWCGHRVFQPVLDKILSLPSEDIESIFGSDFRSYAHCGVGGHGEAINYRTGYNTIEFRLPRIQNSEQYLRVCKYWREIVSIVNEHGALVDHGVISASDLGAMCGKVDVRWNKFSKGR